MARLQSEAQYGYYPTPDAALDLIAGSIKPPKTPGPLYLLDPCCGEGSALRRLADSLEKRGAKMMTDGIEIQTERAEQAGEKLDRVFCQDLFATKIESASYDLILLNPPYRDRKLELQFLMAVHPALATWGLLVYIVPKLSAAAAADQLATRYEDICMREFPPEQAERFKQVVITARKRRERNLNHLSEKAKIVKFARTPIGDPDALYSSEDSERFHLVAREDPKQPSITLDSLSDHALLDAAEKRGVFSEGSAIRDLMEPEASNHFRPLAPLTKGHLAQYVAAGFINNAVADDLLLSGTCYKTPVRVESEDKIVTIEKLTMELVALDLQTFRSYRLK